MFPDGSTPDRHSDREPDLAPEPEIVCVDCGGRCFLLTQPREDGQWFPGDFVAYRCEDCRDRWDLVLPDAADNRGA